MSDDLGLTADATPAVSACAHPAGLNPISIVTELRRRHNIGEAGTGINVRKNCITDM